MENNIKAPKAADFSLVRQYHDPVTNTDIYEMLPQLALEDGSFAPDPEKKPRYFSKVVIMIRTPLGQQQQPFNFEILAKSISEAIEVFPAAASAAAENAVKEIESQATRATLLRGVDPPSNTRQ